MTDPPDPATPAASGSGESGSGAVGPDVPAPDPGVSAAGWAAVAPERPRPYRPESRIRLAISWIIAAIVLGFTAWIAYRTSTGSAAFREGRAIGTALGAIFFATALRWAWLRLTRGRGERPLLRSSWIPLGAVLLVIVYGFQGLTSAVVAADPSGSLRIAAPYSLAAADPEIADQITATMRSDASVRAAVREIRQGSELAGWLIAGNGSFGDEDWDELVGGMEHEAGQTAVSRMIRGHEVAVLAQADTTIAAWIEPPMVLIVIAGDANSAQSIAEAVLTSP